MSKRAEPQAGAIYHVARSKVTSCSAASPFQTRSASRPMSVGYFLPDTHLSRPDAGDGRSRDRPADRRADRARDSMEEDGGIDGSVVDADGYIWNARWGAGTVDRYSPDGLRIARYRVPAAQPSCPAFIGPGADRLAVTTAWEGLGDAARANQPDAGALLELGVTVARRFDAAYIL